MLLHYLVEDGLKSLGIKGSLLVADEGINGTIAGVPEKLDAALGLISRITGLQDFSPKFSTSDVMPFRRMKVRLEAVREGASIK